MRVLVVINKWWECDPALASMLNDNTRPPDSPWPEQLQPARPRPELAKEINQNPIPRAIFPYRHFNAEVWCISDLLDSFSTQQQSSSERKAGLLPKIFEFGPSPDLVIAVGTASTPDPAVNWNGGVVVGTGVFMNNGQPNGSNPDSNLNLPTFDQLIESSISLETFRKLASVDNVSIVNRFLPVPLNSSALPGISIGFGDVALGTVNVSQSSNYATCDPLTIKAFDGLQTAAKAVSLETTHGLIRVQSDSPFIFVSGIVNRFQQFGVDVVPRLDAQNTAGAHNTGVAVTWMLSSLDEQL
jgi:hypothetical protein